MSNVRRSLFLVSAIVLFTHCSKKLDSTELVPSSAPAGGTCDRAGDGFCQEFSELRPPTPDVRCGKAGGVYSKERGCPRANLLGTCVRPNGDKNFFYVGNTQNMTTADAKKLCDSTEVLWSGKWTEGPSAAQATVRKLPEPSKIKASCNIASEGTCSDYGDVTASVIVVPSICTGSMKGQFAKVPCPTDGLVGSCIYPTGRTERYYAPKSGKRVKTGAERKADCEIEMGSRGFFVEGPEYRK